MAGVVVQGRSLRRLHAHQQAAEEHGKQQAGLQAAELHGVTVFL